MNKAAVLGKLGDNRAGNRRFYDLAIEIRERLVNQEVRRELKNDLAM